ncbi:hypothetical protein P175DRAFT_0492539 [Aspergillus ochraceoroseus IBT 24754]|uniref:Exosome complex protein n=1 Tax=Aspergillus ochraceoroseus IBT 24754 TaxID=1392256 RepID=A0A2T5M077_9EURO|nr:uncharacterized protein P175DRAFT_0492539 [Aspergillus ochraceoroseus IBT 24754]PTU21926.1 hypothetical protein P175DRAFT_0492539 [Aspergillus ochraceoroseus IBT 24754]
MDTTDIITLLEQLDDNVDDLEEILNPILDSTVVETSKKLPVLDKAKFHVLVTYTLESLLFSYLRLHGVNAKEHPVFRELTRVKQYFEKIKALETEPEQRTMTLDKQAASRFIKHGLAGNEKFDLERKEQIAKEKARAQLKASLLAKNASATPETSSKNHTSDSDSDSGSDSNQPGDEEETKASQPQQTSTKSQKGKKGKDAKHPNRRTKEGRKEQKKDRKKKKVEARKARKTT